MRLLFDARLHLRVAQIAAALASCCVAAACDAGASSDARSDDAGVSDAAPTQALCPKTSPPPGSGCELPEGTTCDFGQCGTNLGTCSRGAWRFGANGRPTCPAKQPDLEAVCSACWPQDVTCVYGSKDCSAGDASPNTAVVSCVDRKWTVEIRPCRDGGADVQRDAGLDGG